LPYLLLQLAKLGNYSFVFKFCLNLYHLFVKCTAMHAECDDPLQAESE
jgi:hypothetical protein